MSNELRKQGHHITGRRPWGLASPGSADDEASPSLAVLERKVADEGVVLTEAQVAALERKRDDEEASGEIETAHPGYLGAPENRRAPGCRGADRDCRGCRSLRPFIMAWWFPRCSAAPWYGAQGSFFLPAAERPAA